MEDSVGTLLDQYLPRQACREDWDLAGLRGGGAEGFQHPHRSAGLARRRSRSSSSQALRERVVRAVHEAYDAKVARIGAPIMRHVEKRGDAAKLDQHWREHLAAMDYLRQGIHLRGYAQKDYRFEFKREAFEMFAAMLERIKFETSSLMATHRGAHPGGDRARGRGAPSRLMRALQAQHAEAASVLAGAAGAQSLPRRLARCPSGVRRRAGARAPCGRAAAAAAEPAGTFVRSERKVGRNEPCPCGSGKKYKHCHGALSSVE